MARMTPIMGWASCHFEVKPCYILKTITTGAAIPRF